MSPPPKALRFTFFSVTATGNVSTTPAGAVRLESVTSVAAANVSVPGVLTVSTVPPSLVIPATPSTLPVPSRVKLLRWLMAPARSTSPPASAFTKVVYVPLS